MDRAGITTVGVVLLVLLAGCGGFVGGSNGGGTNPVAGGGNDGGGGGSTTTAGTANATATPTTAPAEQFSFPPGTDASSADPITLASRGEQIVADTSRYRLTQKHTVTYRERKQVEADGRTFEYEVVRSDRLNTTYDVGEEAIHELKRQNRYRIESWTTADRIVAQSNRADSDHTGKWVSSPAFPEGYSEQRLHVSPLRESNLPEYLKSASLTFDGIVTVDGRPHAKYTGNVTQPGAVDAREFGDVKTEHVVQSISSGSVTVLVDEGGAIRSVSYEFTGDVVRITPDGRSVKNATITGTIELQYRGLSDMSKPKWAESPPSDEFVQFDVSKGSPAAGYELVSDTTLPGAATDTPERALFVVAAEFQGQTYVAEFRPSIAFEPNSALYVALSRTGEGLKASGNTIDGSNAFTSAVSVEVSVYLHGYQFPTIPIYHARLYPT